MEGKIEFIIFNINSILPSIFAVLPSIFAVSIDYYLLVLSCNCKLYCNIDKTNSNTVSNRLR